MSKLFRYTLRNSKGNVAQEIYTIYPMLGLFMANNASGYA